MTIEPEKYTEYIQREGINYFVNLVNSLNIPMILLDREFKIQNFTAQAEKILNLVPSDIGKLISNTNRDISIPNLVSAMLNVMQTRIPQEFEIKNKQGHWYSLRIYPYKRVDQVIEGTILLLVDIHGNKLARDMAEAIVQTVREPLLALNQELRVMTANRSFYETYKVSKEATEDQLIYDLGNKQWDIPKLREMLVEILNKSSVMNDFEVEHEFQKIGKRTMLLNARKIDLESEGTKSMILLAIEDITERRHSENLIRDSLREKEVLLKEIHHRVKNNLNIVSSLLELQADVIQDESALKAFKESQNRIRSIALIHEKLYQSADLSRIDFGEYVNELTTKILSSFGFDSDLCQMDIKISDIRLSVDMAIPCSLIINELVSNCLKHAFPDKSGKILISLSLINETNFELYVTDNGVGFPSRLNFKTTKSLGLQLVNTLVNQIDGIIEMNASNGTSFKIVFPVK